MEDVWGPSHLAVNFRTIREEFVRRQITEYLKRPIREQDYKNLTILNFPTNHTTPFKIGLQWKNETFALIAEQWNVKKFVWELYCKKP